MCYVLNWKDLSYFVFDLFPKVKYLVLLKLLASKVWYYLNLLYLCSVIIKQAITIKNIQS